MCFAKEITTLSQTELTVRFNFDLYFSYFSVDRKRRRMSTSLWRPRRLIEWNNCVVYLLAEIEKQI
jgi:hypothetical protein